MDGSKMVLEAVFSFGPVRAKDAHKHGFLSTFKLSVIVQRSGVSVGFVALFTNIFRGH